jgi:hemerythrin-like metal-binding protein
MTNQMPMGPADSVGHATLDAQHKKLLAHCKELAACLADADDDRFDAIFRDLMTLANDHFATEADLLERSAYPELDAYEHECEEFGYLADEIITPENFDRQELQTFLTLWWTGHVLGGVREHRSFLLRG